LTGQAGPIQDDYANATEPSVEGGEKIARYRERRCDHDFAHKRTEVFVR
jgi:hypothetical protein